MEILLNFDEKEVAVQEVCNFAELHKKLKKLLGDDLRNWKIAGVETKWIYQYWPTIIYQEPYKITWKDSTNPYEFTYGDSSCSESIVCFSDNKEDYEAV